MKLGLIFALLAAVAAGLAAATPVSGQAMNADDLRWVNQCIGDKGERRAARPR